MIALMTIMYTAVVVVVFFLFKVKPRPYPVAITVTVGVLMIGGIVIFWLPSAPVSKRTVVTRYVVQLVPYVKGQVQSIRAQPNEPLNKGDVLFEINPEPYQYALQLAKAQLLAGQGNAQQADAAVRVAEAAIAKADADVAQAKASLDVAKGISEQDPAAMSKLKLEEATNGYAASQAGQQQASAGLQEAEATAAAAKDNVKSLEAQVQVAEFNRQECTVRAPANGFVTDWQIREGTYVTSIPLAAAGTFVDTSETFVVAPFPVNLLRGVKPGQEVELVFMSRPGKLYRGKVDNVIEASGEGQFTTGGKLPSAASIGSPGYLAVKIQLNDPEVASELAMGTPGAVAVYTDRGKPFAMISKVAIRMQKWLYFLPF